MNTQISYLHIASEKPSIPVGINKMSLILLQSAHAGMDDPGMPGGDPDLPETPLDSGLYFLIIIALIYGLWRIRSLRTTPQ